MPNVLESLKVFHIGNTPPSHDGVSTGHRLFRVQCDAGYVKIALSSEAGKWRTQVYESTIAEEHIRNATVDAFWLDVNHYARNVGAR